jgi:hypothetical protein
MITCVQKQQKIIRAKLGRRDEATMIRASLESHPGKARKSWLCRDPSEALTSSR